MSTEQSSKNIIETAEHRLGSLVTPLSLARGRLTLGSIVVAWAGLGEFLGVILEPWLRSFYASPGTLARAFAVGLPAIYVLWRSTRLPLDLQDALDRSHALLRSQRLTWEEYQARRRKCIERYD